jgi:hypothetical protein
MQSNQGLGHSPEHHRSTRSGSRRRAGIAGAALAAAALTTSVLVSAPGASAAPLDPHAHTLFPDRDFVSLEGYPVTTPAKVLAVSVRRGTLITGMADAPVGSDGIAEVNHPGGACWSQVPDLKAGDVVTVDDGVKVESTTVQDTSVTGIARTGLTVTVSGRVVGVPAGQLEQRIVDPRLTNLIGRRDARAATPTAAAGRVSAGKLVAYTSKLEVPAGGTTFKATYVVRAVGTSATAATAANNVAAIFAKPQLGPRAMAWEDPAALGLTISELGEVGGAIAGCPGASTAPGALPTGIQEVRVNWKAGQLRVRGATPGVGQTVVLRRDTPTGAPMGSDVTVAAVDGHTGGDFDIRITGASVNAKPGELWLTATGGGFPALREGPIVVG